MRGQRGRSLPHTACQTCYQTQLWDFTPESTAAGASPWTPLGSVQRSPMSPSWWGSGESDGEAGKRILALALEASGFGLSGLAVPLAHQPKPPNAPLEGSFVIKTAVQRPRPALS